MSQVWLVWQDGLLASVWDDEVDARWAARRGDRPAAVCPAKVRSFRRLCDGPVVARYLEEEQDDYETGTGAV